MTKYQQNDKPSRKLTEYERSILYAFYGPVPATSNDEAILLKVKNAVEAAEPELKRLHAENEKLRAALNYIDGMAATICMKNDAGYPINIGSVMDIYMAARRAAALKETGDD